MTPTEVATFNQAVATAQAGQKQEAYRQLKALQLSSPADTSLLLWIAFTTDDLNEAEAMIDRAGDLDPTNPSVKSAKGWISSEKAKRTVASAPPPPIFPPPAPITASSAPAWPAQTYHQQPQIYQPSAERTLYQAQNVLITNTRAVFANRTYPIASITSVRTIILPPHQLGSTLTILLGMGVAGVGFLFMANVLILAITCWLFGIFFFVIGSKMMEAEKPTYVVKVGNAGNEHDGLFSQVKDEVDAVTQAITQALIQRG